MSDTALVLMLNMVPDRRLAPNAMKGRSRWYSSPLIEAQREQAKKSVESAYVVNETLTGPVSVDVTIYWGKTLKAGKKRARVEQDRRLDWDSCTVLVKPMIDGALVDTGILRDDRQIDHGTVRQTIDPDERGYTIIRISELEAA